MRVLHFREKERAKNSYTGKYLMPPSVETYVPQNQLEAEERKEMKDAYGEYLELEKDLRKNLGLSKKRYPLKAIDSKANSGSFEDDSSFHSEIGSNDLSSNTSIFKVASDISTIVD